MDQWISISATGPLATNENAKKLAVFAYLLGREGVSGLHCPAVDSDGRWYYEMYSPINSAQEASDLLSFVENLNGFGWYFKVLDTGSVFSSDGFYIGIERGRVGVWAYVKAYKVRMGATHQFFLGHANGTEKKRLCKLENQCTRAVLRFIFECWT